nr:structural domain protein [uncultured Pantoea sp.]
MSSGTDIAGTAAGGPLWMMGKGMYDISAEVGKNVVSLKNFMQGKTEGNAALKIEPPVTHPPVTAAAKQPPAVGKPKSADGYKSAQQAKAVQVTQEQTKILAANDDRIISGLDDVRDEIKKLAHAFGGKDGGLLDSLIPGRRKRRSRKRSPLTTAAGALDTAGDLLTDGKGKPHSKKSAPEPKKKGLLTKAMEVLKGSKKAATVAGAGAAAATTGAAVLAGTKAAGEAAAKEGTKAATDTAGKVAAREGIAVSEKAAATAAEKNTEKGGLKVAGKVAGKTALKAIPLVGTAISAGMDAYEGFHDTEGQKKAFGLKENQAVSGRQKGEYTAANVLNMGGLLSGGAGLLAKGASALGMDGAAKALTFNTGDMAKGLDSGLSKVGDVFTSFSTSAVSAYDKLTGTSAEQTKAITDGTEKTVTAINRLGSQLQGGTWGEDGVGAQGKSTADYADVAKNSIGADLNIGGANAKTRSFRNNNFGNLNFVGQEGASLEAKNAKGEARFAKFNTPEEGFRALANQLTSYSEGTSKAAGYKKLNTVEDIIKLYAPQSENDTSNYVDSLSKKLGVKSNQQLDLKDPKVMTQMMRGIATIEGGNPQVTNDFMMNAIGHNENGKWVGGKFSDESLKSVNEARTKQGLAPVAADSLYSAGDKVKVMPGTATPAAPANAAIAPVQAAPAVVVNAPAAPTGSQVAAAAAKSESKDTSATGLTDRIKQGASSAWGGVKGLNQWADGKLQGAAESLGVEGLARNRPTSGLSLPAGDSLPAGLQLAALSPGQIATRSRPVATSGASFGRARVRPNSATSGSVVDAAKEQVINRAMAVDSAPAQPAAEAGFFDRMMGGAMDGVKAVGSAVMPALGDTFSQTLGGFSGNDMISGVLGQAGITDPGILRAVSPLTSKAGGLLDSGIESLASAGQSFFAGGSASPARSAPQQPLLSHPAQIPNVTDLGASGMRPMMKGDSAGQDSDMLKELKAMRTQLEALLGVTKKKGEEAPDKVVNTAQPAPRQSSSLSISDPALNELLRD